MSFAAAALLSTGAFAEAPLWRVFDGEFERLEVRVDPQILQNPRLAFIVKEIIKDSNQTEANTKKTGADVSKQTKKPDDPPEQIKKQETEASYYLLGATDRSVVILTAVGSCAWSCFSGEHVEIYRIPDQTKFKDAEVLELRDQMALLNGLTKSDKDLMIGPTDADCTSADAGLNQDDGCRSLSDILDKILGDDDGKPRFQSTYDLDQFAKSLAGVGFTPDGNGRTKNLDIYFSAEAYSGTHHRAYKWSIDANLAAPLLKPALRNLIAAGGPAVK